MENMVETNDILVNDENIDDNIDGNTNEDSSITPVAKCDLVPISHKKLMNLLKAKDSLEGINIG